MFKQQKELSRKISKIWIWKLIKQFNVFFKRNGVRERWKRGRRERSRNRKSKKYLTRIFRNHDLLVGKTRALGGVGLQTRILIGIRTRTLEHTRRCCTIATVCGREERNQKWKWDFIKLNTILKLFFLIYHSLQTQIYSN